MTLLYNQILKKEIYPPLFNLFGFFKIFYKRGVLSYIGYLFIRGAIRAGFGVLLADYLFSTSGVLGAAFYDGVFRGVRALVCEWLIWLNHTVFQLPTVVLWGLAFPAELFSVYKLYFLLSGGDVLWSCLDLLLYFIPDEVLESFTLRYERMRLSARAHAIGEGLDVDFFRLIQNIFRGLWVLVLAYIPPEILIWIMFVAKLILFIYQPFRFWDLYFLLRSRHTIERGQKYVFFLKGISGVFFMTVFPALLFWAVGYIWESPYFLFSAMALSILICVGCIYTTLPVSDPNSFFRPYRTMLMVLSYSVLFVISWSIACPVDDMVYSVCNFHFFQIPISQGLLTGIEPFISVLWALLAGFINFRKIRLFTRITGFLILYLFVPFQNMFMFTTSLDIHLIQYIFRILIETSFDYVVMGQEFNYLLLNIPGDVSVIERTLEQTVESTICMTSTYILSDIDEDLSLETPYEERWEYMQENVYSATIGMFIALVVSAGVCFFFSYVERTDIFLVVLLRLGFGHGEIDNTPFLRDLLMDTVSSYEDKVNTLFAEYNEVFQSKKLKNLWADFQDPLE